MAFDATTVLRDIRSHLEIPGNIVQVCTYGRAVQYGAKCRDMFAVRDGNLYVRRGRTHWDCLSMRTGMLVALRFWTAK